MKAYDFYVVLGTFAAMYAIYRLLSWLIKTYKDNKDYYPETVGRQKVWGIQFINDSFWFFIGTVVSLFSPEIRIFLIQLFSSLSP